MQWYQGKLFLWQHVHTHLYFFKSLVSLLLWTVFFVIWLLSSPWGWDHFCPAISRMNCIFHHICLWYVWSYVCIFVIFLIFSYLFTCHLLMQNISFFPFLFVHFLRKFRVNYIDELYTDISFIIVSYFVYTFYYTHVLLFHEIFSVFQLTFFAVIIMSICTHSHGSAKHWWHSSWSIVWYMLTSTKISFVETLCSYDEMHVSVISQVTSYSYWLYFYVNIMSMTLYVVSCDMFFSVQHIYKSSYDIFEQIWYVYVVW